MGKSHQRGWVVPRGKKWYGYFRKSILDSTTNQQKSDVVSVILGLESQMKASEAREALECEITKRTGQRGPSGGRAMNDSSATFGWFVRKRFFPLKEANWKEETAKVKKFIIQRDLIDPFERIPLENFDKFTLQIHLNSLARTRSRDRVLQLEPTCGISLLRQSTKTSLSKTQLAKWLFQPNCATRTGQP
jgi:hypothetical protein